MANHKKSCTYCEAFIPKQAYTCKRCGNIQIGISQAKEDYLRSIWLKHAPFAYVVMAIILFFDRGIGLMYSLNEVDFRALVAILSVNVLMAMFVELYILARHEFSLYSHFGKRALIILWIQDLEFIIRKLLKGNIFNIKIDYSRYSVDAPVPLILREVKKNRQQATIFFTAIIIGLCFVAGVSILSYQNNLTKQEFYAYLKTEVDYDLLDGEVPCSSHYVDQIFNAGIFTIFGSVSVYEESVEEKFSVSRAFVSIGKKVFKVAEEESWLPEFPDVIEEYCLIELKDIPQDLLGLPPKGNIYSMVHWYKLNEDRRSFFEPKSHNGNLPSDIKERLDKISF